MIKFTSIVEKVKRTLSFDEKQELYDLLEKYLIEARRDEIKENVEKSKKEKGLKFSSDIKKLRSHLQ